MTKTNPIDLPGPRRSTFVPETAAIETVEENTVKAAVVEPPLESNPEAEAPAIFEQLQADREEEEEEATRAQQPLAPREVTLDDASNLISVDRDAEYGPAQESFARIATIWTAIFGFHVTEKQVALAMSGVKMARLAYQHDHRDSWVDMAGYAALGSEVIEQDATARYRTPGRLL